MKEILVKLMALQQIDTKLIKLENLKGDLPQKVEVLKIQVTEEEERLITLENNLVSYIKERDLVEMEIKDLETKKTKYQDQLYEVKNNREYDAVTQEIETVLKEISSQESRLLELMDKEEETQTDLENTKKRAEELKEEFGQLSIELTKRLDETEKDETDLKKKRAGLVKDFDRKILTAYNRIRVAKQGLAVAPILRHSLCGGCYKNLPPSENIGNTGDETSYSV